MATPNEGLRLLKNNHFRIHQGQCICWKNRIEVPLNALCPRSARSGQTRDLGLRLTECFHGRHGLRRPAPALSAGRIQSVRSYDSRNHVAYPDVRIHKFLTRNNLQSATLRAFIF
jgi:hypothetical protein